MRILLLLGVAAIALTSASAVEIQVPILSVRELSNGKLEGALATCTLEITDRKTEKPLTVSVTEDSPSAIGNQLRAAVWLAATTVALEREDPLTGYRIEVIFSGSFDGPSAGGVIALALLSALEHKELPDDFAFTGTILPNGSVGQVGGVSQKIEAAAKAGKRRILLPTFYRVDTDPNTGKRVDFKDLCESLGVEYVPVENLSDAYRKLYNLDLVKAPLSALKASGKIEAILKDDYADAIESGGQIFNALPDSERDQLKQDKLGKIFLKARSDAENYMREGNFVLADENATLWSAWLSARNQNVQFLKGLDSEADTGDVIESLSQEVAKESKEVWESVSSYAESRSWTKKAQMSELDNYCRDLPLFLGWVDLLSFQIQPLIEKRKQIADTKESFWDIFKSGPSRKEQLNDIDQQVYILKLSQLLFVNIARDLGLRDKQQMEKFAKLYKDYSPQLLPFQKDCENLVYNASVATDESFTADTIQEWAKQAGIDIDSAKVRFALSSLPYLSSLGRRKLCEDTHQRLNRESDFYSVALATQDHGFALTAATRLIVAMQCGWNEDEEGRATYSNTGLIRSLLESSRTEALAAIAKCESKDIPCWNPIMLVLSADGKRDDPEQDRMEVLEAYLQAGVQAKILKLLFSNSLDKPK